MYPNIQWFQAVHGVHGLGALVPGQLPQVLQKLQNALKAAAVGISVTQGEMG